MDDVAVSSGQRIFVQWHGTGTNLEPLHGHRPDFHESHMNGVDVITFNEASWPLVLCLQLAA